VSSDQKTHSRLLAAATAVAAIAFAAWLCRLCTSRPDIYFLEQHAPAAWIVYPKPSLCMLYKDSEVSATFGRTFVLKGAPTNAKLSLRALTRWSLAINNAAVGSSVPGRNWKDATELDVAGRLHPGTNEILVTVFSTNSPPALWLALDAAGTQIVSDAAWDVSLMDAVTMKAAIAGAPVEFGKGNPIAGAEAPLPSLLKHIFTLLISGAFSAALLVRGGAWLKNYELRGSPHGSLDSPRAIAIAVAVPAVLWAALFLNNHHLLPPRAGYDADNHLEHINYIRTRWKLPLATDGWQMYQPPLYYAISAVLLAPFSASAFSPQAAEILRTFGFCIGVAQFSMVFLCLRLLFPGRLGLQWFGLVLAAFLPECLGVSQFATNECLAATFFSAAVYFCLRILKEDSNSPKLFFGFGLCLGATLLTKFTGIIGIPFFAVALLSRPAFNTRFPSRIRLSNVLLGFVVAFIACGWHYFRVWRHFGNPLIGNWDPASGYHWWMEDGYHVRAWLFRFGTCLRYPWFSGANGFADGLYSTLWGDGLWSGVVTTTDRPPWNYEMMAASYVLALLPTCLILIGGVIALRRFIRKPEAAWFLLLGVVGATLAALIFMCLKLPSYHQVKAFYGMIAVVPICALATLGMDFLTRRSKLVGLTAGTLMGAWALSSFTAYWIRSSDPETHLTLGRYYADKGNPSAATQEYLEACRLAPRNPKVRDRLAFQLSRQNPAETARLVEMNLSEFPDFAESHSVKASLLGGQKQIDAGIAEAKKSIELAPDQAYAYPPLWNLYMESGRYRDAAEVGRAGLRISPFDAELQRKTGFAFLRDGDSTNACIHYAHAVTLQPDVPEMRDGSGLALMASHNSEAAVNQFKRAVELKSDDANYHYHLAQALAAVERFDEAIAQCKRALELDPSLSDARDTLKRLQAINMFP
jgi:tetratricopeptide (TPR) repeat protein